MQSAWYTKTTKKNLPRKRILELHNEGKDIYQIGEELEIRPIQDVGRFLYLASIKPNNFTEIKSKTTRREKVEISQEKYETLLIDAFEQGVTPINLMMTHPKQYLNRDNAPTIETCRRVINSAYQKYKELGK